jgi:hypothetical protein
MLATLPDVCNGNGELDAERAKDEWRKSKRVASRKV